MRVTPLMIPEVLLIEPDVYGDERGFFMETFHEERYRREAGIQDVFVQDNRSRSAFGVLRGLHFQRQYPQGKLVRVTQGEVFDVAVDIRADSATFGNWVGHRLSETNHLQLWVPPGFAHGFVVLSESADFEYKCTEFYRPEDEGVVLWSDPGIGIQWPVTTPSVSKKDRAAPRLQDAAI